MAYRYQERERNNILVEAINDSVELTGSIIRGVTTATGSVIIGTAKATGFILGGIFSIGEASLNSVKNALTSENNVQSKSVDKGITDEHQIRLLVIEYMNFYNDLAKKDGLLLVASSCSPPPPPNDPDDSNNKRIVAAIVSALLVGSGVCLIIISGGTATPGVILCRALLINTGMSGLNYCIKKDFSWSEWTKAMTISGAITLIIFGGNYLINGYVGLALRFAKDLDLSEEKVKAIVEMAGALAGAGTRIGIYIIECQINGKKVDRFELVLKGIQGAIDGYLTARVQNVSLESNAKSSLEINLENDKTPKIELDYVESKSIIGHTIEELDPEDIRYSQTYVNYNSLRGTNFADLLESMNDLGYQGDPLNVVRMPDGLLTSMDNRRLLAAHLTLRRVKVIIHKFNERRNDGKTWGQVITERIRNQDSESFRSGYGSFTRPSIHVLMENYEFLLKIIQLVAKNLGVLKIFSRAKK